MPSSETPGETTCSGNDDRATCARSALATAWAIRRLLDCGASLDGKTITDELACGLLGMRPTRGAVSLAGCGCGCPYAWRPASAWPTGGPRRSAPA